MAKAVLAGALAAIPVIGLAGAASAQPGFGPRSHQPDTHSHYQPGGPRTWPGDDRSDPHATPGDYPPPQDRWHHPYYPPMGYRDVPEAPIYPLGGYPPAIWWAVLQAIGLA